MPALRNSRPDLASQVGDKELVRLLGYPKDFALEGEVLLRAKGARAWYAQNGRAWSFVRRHDVASVGHNIVQLTGGAQIESRVVAARFTKADAHALFVAGFTAGSEADDYAKELWATDRPDEAFFLDRFATAVVEHMVRSTGADLCREVGANDEYLLSHYSPGFAGWPIEGQHGLLDLLAPGDGAPVSLLSSGMLVPTNSLLGIFGITRQVTPWPKSAKALCQACLLTSCQFRRTR